MPRRVGAHSESEMQFLLPTGKASENQRNQAGFHAPSLWAAASAAMGCALKFPPSLSQKYDLKGKKKKRHKNKEWEMFSLAGSNCTDKSTMKPHLYSTINGIN